MIPRSGMRAGAAGIADQVILSVTNLAIGLALAREMEPSMFGVYAVAFSIALVGSSVQVSLVTDPLIILGSGCPPDDQSRYFAALVRIQLLIAVCVAAGTGLLAASLHALWGLTSRLPAALAGVCLASIPLQLQLFFRAVLFARLRAAAVLWHDSLFTAAKIAGIALLILSDAATPLRVFVVFGVAALLSVATQCVRCADVLSCKPDSTRVTRLSHWRYGRWLLATSAAYWCSGQAPVLLTASLLTPVAAAIIKACQYLVAPLNVALTGLDGILAPRASRAAASGGDRGLRKFTRLVALGAGAAVVVYSVGLLPAAAPLMDLLYRGRYAGYTPIVALLLAGAFFSAVARGPILRLKVHQDTRSIFRGYVWGAAAGLSSLLLLAPAYGVIGAATAAPAASGALLIYLVLAPPTPLGIEAEAGRGTLLGTQS